MVLNGFEWFWAKSKYSGQQYDENYSLVEGDISWSTPGGAAELK